MEIKVEGTWTWIRTQSWRVKGYWTKTCNIR